MTAATHLQINKSINHGVEWIIYDHMALGSDYAKENLTYIDKKHEAANDIQKMAAPIKELAQKAVNSTILSYRQAYGSQRRSLKLFPALRNEYVASISTFFLQDMLLALSTQDQYRLGFDPSMEAFVKDDGTSYPLIDFVRAAARKVLVSSENNQIIIRDEN